MFEIESLIKIKSVGSQACQVVIDSGQNHSIGQLGNELKVGDRSVFGKTALSSNGFLRSGINQKK